MLRPLGRSECLLGEHAMGEYRCIRESLERGDSVRLSLVPRCAIPELALMGGQSLAVHYEEHGEIEEVPAPVGSHAQLCRRSQRSLNIDKTIEANNPTIGANAEAEVETNIHTKKRNSTGFVSLWSFERTPLRVHLLAADNLNHLPPSHEFFYVRVGVLVGTSELVPALTSPLARRDNLVTWQAWLHFCDLVLASVPRNARLCFTLYGRRSGKNESVADEAVGWANLMVLDEGGFLRHGSMRLRLWPGEPVPGSRGRQSAAG